MRKRILRGAAVLAALAVPFGAATASGSFFAGTYAGKITGVQGIALPQTAGNMKFKITRSGKVSTFQASKILVACADGNVHRTSFHVRRIAVPIQSRVFVVKGTNSSGATLKAKGVIRGQDHARGYLRFKGVMQTDAGTLDCNTGRQFWSAKHVS